MKDYYRRSLYNVLFILTFIILAAALVLSACNSGTAVPSATDTTATGTTVVVTTTTVIPTGVAGSDLLPEDAPEAQHFLTGGTCLQCHEPPASHTGEVLNLFGCNRCHVQTSTVIPSTTPTVVPKDTLSD